MKKHLLIITLLTGCIVSCQLLGGGGPTLDLIPYMSGDKWGYIDRDGNIVVNPQFSDAGMFVDGVALVASADNKYGYIGTDGKYKVNPTYKSATSFSEGLACVVPEDGKPQFIDEDGNVKFTINEGRYCGVFNQGLALVGVESEQGVKWGYVNKEGKVIINPQFDAAGIFSEGLAAVAMRSKEGELLWGFIDQEGAITVNYQFKGGSIKFSDGLARVSDGEKTGYVDKDGKYVINPQFDYAGEFKNGLAPIRQGEMSGFIDEDGKMVINPQFSNVMYFSGGIAAVSSSDGKYGYIDKDGKYVINPQFERASDFFGSIAFVRNADKWGIIDKGGKYLVNPQFDLIRYDMERSSTTKVESDYFDVSAIVRGFLDGTDDASFRNLRASTTVGQLRAIFPAFQVSNYEWSGHASDNIVLNDHSFISNVKFTFSESPSAGRKPVYRSQTSYDYWKGSVTKQVVDRYENIPNENATLASVAFTLQLSGRKARSRSDKIFQGISDELGTVAALVKGDSPREMENSNMTVVMRQRNNSATYAISFKKSGTVTATNYD